MFFYLYSVLVLFAWFALAFMTMFWVPSDAMQGVAQRIFYFHVPTAWVSGVGFLLAAIYSVKTLKTRSLADDAKASVYVSLGWFFTSGVLITGPLWAKPIWGDYWNWSDQRLITFFILWLTYSAYLILRLTISDPDKRARFSAVVALLAFLNVPLVYLAIRLWNTPSHPSAVIGGDEGSGLKNYKMSLTFWYSVICFHLLFFQLAYINIRRKKLALQALR